MHTVFALVLTAAAAVVIARPPGSMVTTSSLDNMAPLSSPTRKYLKDYLHPRYMWPHYFSVEHSPRQSRLHLHHAMPASVWLNQELERLHLMQQRASETFKTAVPLQMPHDPSYIKRMLAPSLYDLQARMQPYYGQQPWPARSLVAEKKQQHAHEEDNSINYAPIIKPINNEAKKNEFALTPRDDGYFKFDEQDNRSANDTLEEVHRDGYQQGLHEGGGQPVLSPQTELGPPRQIRQNPNLSRTKTLIAENLDKLKIGLSNKEYRLPVSLLPSNLRWLKISRPTEVNVSAQDFGPTDKSGQIHMLETTVPDSTGSFYGVAVLSAIGAAAVLAILGFALGWYTLSKRAKAAADVDYPAYGVTGPNVDTSSGDRKLAHSAHMYHYQHQKQQIIAMEKNGMEQGNGSVSDPDSEDENEEGDYTVYECPGFATTGDMEVKNPLFNEEPTPATPGKCEVVKPQPKD